MGTANPVGSDGPVVAGSPIGPCEVVLVGGDDGLPRVGEALSFPDVAGGSLPVVPAGGSSSVGTTNPVGSDGPVVAGSPIGPCETLSPLFRTRQYWV